MYYNISGVNITFGFVSSAVLCDPFTTIDFFAVNQPFGKWGKCGVIIQSEGDVGA